MYISAWFKFVIVCHTCRCLWLRGDSTYRCGLKQHLTGCSHSESLSLFLSHTPTHTHLHRNINSPESSTMSNYCVLSSIDLLPFFPSLALLVLLGPPYQGCLWGILWVKDTCEWRWRQRDSVTERETEIERQTERVKEGKKRWEIRGLPPGVIAFLTLCIDSSYQGVGFSRPQCWTRTTSHTLS